MKRTAALVGVPLVLIALWWTSENSSDHSAQVAITAERPTELRPAVIAAVVGLGGVRVEEETTYGGRGASTLVFDVPTARLEDALRALDDLGGTVTEQRVDLASAADEADRLGASLDEIGECMEELAAGGSSSTRCRATLDEARERLDSSTVERAQSRLAVEISPAGVSNPALVIAIALLCSAAFGLAVLLWRASRRPTDVDLRDLTEFASDDDDLHLRRN